MALALVLLVKWKENNFLLVLELLDVELAMMGKDNRVRGSGCCCLGITEQFDRKLLGPDPGKATKTGRRTL